MEVEYKLLGELRNDSAVQEQLFVLLQWPIEIVESDADWRSSAARIKSRGRISLADAWVASLALKHDAELVHKDPEFDAVGGLKSLKLPYDRDTARRSN